MVRVNLYKLRGIRHRYGSYSDGVRRSGLRRTGVCPGDYNRRGLQSDGGSFLLDIPELIVEQGAALGITGPNGSGKSTFLRILALLEEPQEGTVLFRGEDAFRKAESLRKNVVLLFQNPYLLKRSVFENVAYGLRVRGMRNGLERKVEDALHAVGLEPARFMKRRWHELSGGESHRVALAARIAVEPEVLILDEPTAHVDHQSAAEIKHAIGAVRERYGTALIIASHDQLWLGSVVDETFRMFDGRIVEHGTSNLLKGPWLQDPDGLWRKVLPDGQAIAASAPPSKVRQTAQSAIQLLSQSSDAVAILDPGSIMLSTKPPAHVSAQNALSALIVSLTAERERGMLRVELDAAGIPLTASITERAARSLALMPGMRVWAVFKATSLHWY